LVSLAIGIGQFAEFLTAYEKAGSSTCILEIGGPVSQPAKIGGEVPSPGLLVDGGRAVWDHVELVPECRGVPCFVGVSSVKVTLLG